MTEYVVLIAGDEDNWWKDMTEEQRKHAYAEHGRFSAELEKRGHTVTGGAELHRSSEARSIPTGGGTPTDGPFVESTEQIGGFYLVRSEDLDDLLECCQILARLGDGIEVRRCVEAAERPE
jgi:hypothetical protein